MMLAELFDTKCYEVDEMIGGWCFGSGVRQLISCLTLPLTSSPVISLKLLIGSASHVLSDGHLSGVGTNPAANGSFEALYDNFKLATPDGTAIG